MSRGDWIRDAIVALLLAALAVALLASLDRKVPDTLFGRVAGDSWFQADTPRTLSNMVNAHSNHFRTKVHPISSIALHPLVTALRVVWPGTDIEAAMRFMWLLAAVWVAAFYALCRLIGSGRVAGAAYGLLGIGSAGFMFWFAVPETYGPGSLTLLAVLVVAALAKHRPVGDRLLIAASIASLSITVTNWIAGLVLAAVERPWRRAVRISAIAFVVVSVLAVVQRFFYSFAKLFFLGSREEVDYVNLDRAGTLLDKLPAMFWSPISLPDVLVEMATPPKLNWVTVQLSAPGSGSAAGMVALLLWTVLLVAGVVGLVRSPEWHRFGKVVGVTLLVQVVMHCFYGDETFLYAAHFLPLLLAVAVFAQRSPLGRLAPVLAVVVAGLAAFNNIAMFSKSVELLTLGH
ncbi:MAG: hypothetical protein KJ901_21330 [Gammaproteobacteria bacterium]|nr:hypothetical protein [Gammaproteobacteria bacterium]MBU1439789.1 hypothetical protein [Gammaproteobacteria bacterium]